MCTLRAHIKFSIFKNIFSGIEKVIITFSILEKKIFQKWKLMCALRAHVSKIHKKKCHIVNQMNQILHQSICSATLINQPEPFEIQLHA